MKKFEPLVSIIIPVYNGSNYMREAIDSALTQTYANIEIIVVNDGSNDCGLTEMIALGYGERIKYISKTNGGVSTALNVGIKNMKGEYFSWLSHDDVYTPDKIEKAIKVLAKQIDKKTIVYCGSCHIDKNSRGIGGIHRSIIDKGEITYTWQESLMILQRQGSMNGCAFLIHKDVLKECGLFDETLRFNQDGFMWNKIFLKGYHLVCISDICVKNRVHDKQLTQTGQVLFHSDCEKMSRYLIPELARVSTVENNIIFQYMLYNAKHANYAVVKKAHKAVKKMDLISIKEELKLAVIKLYGVVRPVIRKMYYLLRRGMKTT